MDKSGKIFFASDFHLGLKVGGDPAERERRVVKWLESVASEAAGIYLLGDIFDFWWEYRHVVPKGFTRFLGSVSAITDSGVPVYFFTGNHDMWVGDYLTAECGITIHNGVMERDFGGRRFLLAHGEGLGSTEKGYKLLLWLFRNRAVRTAWSALHPRIGMGIGHRWSLGSRLGKGEHIAFLGEEKEDLLRFARSVTAKREVDYFIFGHRHLPMTYTIDNKSRVVILGD
ncbi:MAG: UDP-2,3-diacylglucosamine diphosphatase, partial [Bacteroidetes bacterium]|nr:UDP-2,3-diacylglucosamine diphosphatase [Bacteroidota bacterium]